jgi:predicted adenylyl cyclase CyaB
MRNLEAKFRLGEAASVRERAEAIGFGFRGILTQHDTFFAVANGKLKLRTQFDGSWLIHYKRGHEGELELSNYQIVAVPDALNIRELLTVALGVIAEVRKTRTLLARRNIRLHLDNVDSLGDFGEIEAVLADDDNPREYRAEVGEILAALQIRASELIEMSYFELMRTQRTSPY